MVGEFTLDAYATKTRPILTQDWRDYPALNMKDTTRNRVSPQAGQSGNRFSKTAALMSVFCYQ